MKMIYSEFDQSTGISTVILQNRKDRYIGKAKIHPEDINYISKITGCKIAEYRAWLQYFKKEVKEAKIKLKALLALKKDISINCPFQEENENLLLKRLNINIKYYEKLLETHQLAIENIKNKIKDDIKIRNHIRSK